MRRNRLARCNATIEHVKHKYVQRLARLHCQRHYQLRGRVQFSREVFEDQQFHPKPPLRGTVKSLKHSADHWTVSRSQYLSMLAAIDVNDYVMLISDSVAQDIYSIFVPLQFDCWLAFVAVVLAVDKCLDEVNTS